MKRILFAGLLAVAALGLGQSQASAICFDVYRPCVRIPLPRLPIFLPHFCIGCDPEGRTGCGHKGTLLFNRANSINGGGYGYGGCPSCAGHPAQNHCQSGQCGGAPLFGYPDCNRPMYPNPGYGYNCWNGVVAPWYSYWPPSAPSGYQIGAYGAFRGPVAAAAAAAAANYPATAPNAAAYTRASYNVPSYWYGK